MTNVSRILQRLKFARTKRRLDTIAFPLPRGRLFYYFVGWRKYKPMEKEACDGVPAAQTALASSLLFGSHGKHDTRESLKWTSKAVAAGDCHAKFLYGYRHLIGIDGDPNPNLAVQWWREAAEAGDPQGCAHIAWAYHFGFCVKADATEAMRWASKAARQGLPPAQYWLGMRYVHGNGVESDLSKAYFWLRLSSACSHGGADKIGGNEFWRYEPNPIAPTYDNARRNAQKVGRELERSVRITVEDAVKVWKPGDNNLQHI